MARKRLKDRVESVALSTSPSPCIRRRWGDLAKAAAAGGVLAATAAIAATGVPSWEASLFHVLNDVPDWVDYVVWLPMQLGSAWAPAIAAAAAWFIAKSWRPVVGSLVAGWGGWWLAKLVKDEIGRGRPYEVLGSHAVRPSSLTEGLGFVSGHSTVAFACAAVLSPYLSRPWRVVVFGLAATVGISRIVVGAHFPLDVVGGAALGLMLAYLWNLAVGVPEPAAG